MHISKTTITVVSLLFSSWFFMDTYFAHAEDLHDAKKDSQINDWSMEQSLNYMQQTHIKQELRQEKSRLKPDTETIEDLRETRRVLKIRSNHLQNLQDQATLNDLKAKEDQQSINIEKIFEFVTE